MITVAVVCIVLCSSLAVGAVFGPTTATDGAADVTTTATAETADENISVGDLSAPTHVRLGETYTVTATVRNEGDFTVREVAYRVVGNVLAAKFVRLPANTTTTVTFEIPGNSITGFPQGTYAHGVFTGGARMTGNLTLASATETTTEERTTTVDQPTTTVNLTTTTLERTTEERTTTSVATRTTTDTETAAEGAPSTAGITRVDVRMENGTLTVTVIGIPSDTETERAVVVRDGELDWEELRRLVELLLDANARQNVTVEGIDGNRP